MSYIKVGGIASDGHVLTTCNMKLLDVPEMGYWTTDNPPRGEICVKTPDMIDGYFKNPKISEEKFVDGYFLTGDIGVIDKGGEIRIIDRKKNLFKLSQGEFVSPEGLEGLYSGASHCISQMYVYGNSLQSNIVAVVVPEHEGLIQMARSLNLVEEGRFYMCVSIVSIFYPHIYIYIYIYTYIYIRRFKQALPIVRGERCIYEGTAIYCFETFSTWLGSASRHSA